MYKKIPFTFILMNLIVWTGGMEVSIAEDKILTDPTRPQIDLSVNKAVLNQNKEFHLSAIFISDTERHAVINDKVVKKGDIIGTKIVKTIDTYKVTLTDNGKENILYLLDPETSIKGQPK